MNCIIEFWINYQLNTLVIIILYINRDISRGAEAYPIQAINEVDDEEFIMEFRYVVKQCHRSGVNIISTVDSMQVL